MLLGAGVMYASCAQLDYAQDFHAGMKSTTSIRLWFCLRRMLSLSDCIPCERSVIGIAVYDYTKWMALGRIRVCVGVIMACFASRERINQMFIGPISIMMLMTTTIQSTHIRDAGDQHEAFT